jgi:hypothetical protein
MAFAVVRFVPSADIRAGMSRKEGGMFVISGAPQVRNWPKDMAARIEVEAC